jgi:hypothetical protein
MAGCDALHIALDCQKPPNTLNMYQMGIHCIVSPAAMHLSKCSLANLRPATFPNPTPQYASVLADWPTPAQTNMSSLMIAHARRDIVGLAEGALTYQVAWLYPDPNISHTGQSAKPLLKRIVIT